MYSSNPNGYPNFSPAPPPFKLEPYGEDESTKIGVPVNSKDQSYSDQSQEPTPVENRPRVDWSTGLCDCLSDWRNCCITCWCPCVTFGKIAEIVDKGSSCKLSSPSTDCMIILGFFILSQDRASN
ncbi:unnamed protein product [Ilex paraguariensis]|uniref:Uncharacterized protein n=1 Tax=Ilex paraguariensis TaxID=185542 RepID=A0ABC8TXI1_9AQUA